MWEKIKHLQRLQMIDLLTHYARMLPTKNIVDIHLNAIKDERSIWMKPRSNHFWNGIVLKKYSESDWIETFRRIYLIICVHCNRMWSQSLFS